LLMSKKVDTVFQTLKTLYYYYRGYGSCQFSDRYLVDSETCGYFYICGTCQLLKSVLNIANSLYKEQKLPNMCLLLNDTDSTKGYGYGYGYEAVKKNLGMWFKNIVDSNHLVNSNKATNNFFFVALFCLGWFFCRCEETFIT
jgi:hypothetical protein